MHMRHGTGCSGLVKDRFPDLDLPNGRLPLGCQYDGREAEFFSAPSSRQEQPRFPALVKRAAFVQLVPCINQRPRRLQLLPILFRRR